MIQSITFNNSSSEHEIFSDVHSLAKWKTPHCYGSQKFWAKWFHTALWSTCQIWWHAPFWPNLMTSSHTKFWSASYPFQIRCRICLPQLTCTPNLAITANCDSRPTTLYRQMACVWKWSLSLLLECSFQPYLLAHYLQVQCQRSTCLHGQLLWMGLW